MQTNPIYANSSLTKEEKNNYLQTFSKYKGGVKRAAANSELERKTFYRVWACKNVKSNTLEKAKQGLNKAVIEINEILLILNVA